MEVKVDNTSVIENLSTDDNGSFNKLSKLIDILETAGYIVDTFYKERTSIRCTDRKLEDYTGYANLRIRLPDDFKF